MRNYQLAVEISNMKYFLWIDEKQDGPYEPEQIREMLRKEIITGVTLGHPEDGTGEWSPIGIFPNVIYTAKPLNQSPASPPAPVRSFSLPQVKDSSTASALAVIAVLELIAAPIAGLVLGSDNTLVGWLVFLSGIISGLILLGFARVIEHLCESTQRLRRIEMLIWKANADKYDK